MSASSNPFRVLGLAPEAIRGLRDEEVHVLVGMVYKAQAKIHHPDAGGLAKRFAELNEANAKLGDPEQFTAAKEDFLRLKRDKLAELESELADAQAKLKDSQHLIQDFVTEMVRSGGYMPPRPLLVNDSILKKGWSEVRAEEGLIVRQPVAYQQGEVKFDSPISRGYKRFDDKWVKSYNDPLSGRVWALSSEAKPLAKAIVGTIPARLDDGEEQRSVRVLLGFQGRPEDFRQAHQGWGWGYFEHLLPHLSMRFEPGRIILAASEASDGNLRFFLLGEIISSG